jgi:hypothetical protein
MKTISFTALYILLSIGSCLGEITDKDTINCMKKKMSATERLFEGLSTLVLNKQLF